MARLLEDRAKKLLAKGGVPVPENGVAISSGEAAEIASRLSGPVVVKALVPVGKRGKAGAVIMARDAWETKEAADFLLGREIGGYPVDSVLVEQRLEIARELYVSFNIDHDTCRPLLLVGSTGGMDVEEMAATRPESMARTEIDPWKGLLSHQARQAWWEAGLPGNLLARVADVTIRLYNVFQELDGYLLEVNPLVVTTGTEVVAAAAVMAVDDAAMARHPELEGVSMGAERTWRPMTILEKQVSAVNEADAYRGTARFTQLDGDLGFMCGGGGASMVLFDCLVAAGGRPANYTEFGGNPPEDKVYGLAKAILSQQQVRGLLVAQNITNNTQVDVVARGVLRAIREMEIDPGTFPVVVREAGVNEDVARELFTSAGVEYYGDDITLEGVCARMVSRMAGKRGL